MQVTIIEGVGLATIPQQSDSEIIAVMDLFVCAALLRDVLLCVRN
jgi:hypothetical protein